MVVQVVPSAVVSSPLALKFILVCTQSKSTSVMVPSADRVKAPAVVSFWARPSASALAAELLSLR